MPAAESLAHCQQLIDDAGAAFALLTRDARVVHCNEAFARLYGRCPAPGATGRGLEELMPRAAAEERAAFVHRALEVGRALVVEELWHGVMLTVTIRPQGPCEHLPDGGVTYVARSAECLALPDETAGDGAIAVTAFHTDLGPLARLTPRELEVLALIGEGMTNGEIARRIHRSDKTVEWHRSQLGMKLGAGTRVDLARLAHRAGLMQRLRGRPSEFATGPESGGVRA